MLARRRRLEETIKETAFPPLTRWEKADFARAGKYITEAEEQLIPYREACMKLRAALEANFSVKEILADMHD